MPRSSCCTLGLDLSRKGWARLFIEALCLSSTIINTAQCTYRAIQRELSFGSDAHDCCFRIQASVRGTLTSSYRLGRKAEAATRPASPLQQGPTIPNAPEWTRTTTLFTQDKALNPIRP